ncbi:MAG: M48 family metalloprotease [Candidatus Omnitrophica bacterium]|nr:M48 family metalloprotease [Candidatus Omnitrophota bacterium]
MPFSFIDIEQKKTRIIGYLFVFVFVFYFITAYLILLVLENTAFPALSDNPFYGFRIPPLEHTLGALAIAMIAGFLHWSMSTSHLIERICLGVGAAPIDPKDAYHQYLRNIVDEVSVAIGGRPLEAVVIPSVSMNAFAIEDFGGRAVIGVTEGLLARLSRAQIEAVVGHEAGHIISGDCLSTTVTCALAEIYDESFSKLGGVLKRTRGRGVAVLVLIYIIIGFMRFMSSFIRYFISRQREYRADAVGVRLTRDPLSLAEALELISRGWRGQGAMGERMQSIFIVNPTLSELDETEGFFSDMFSTHPPVKHRIAILADMAHLDAKTLEENLKNFKRVAPIAKPEFKVDEAVSATEWSVFIKQEWLGPFSPSELIKLEGFKPDVWVRGKGADVTRHAYEVGPLLDLFRSGQDHGPQAGLNCPNCHTLLSEYSYEGVSLLKCTYCEGVFVEQDKINRIFVRRDMDFGEDVQRLARALMESRAKNALPGKIDPKNAWVLDCPRCHSQFKDSFKMRRQFFVYSYPVEIDRCTRCDGIWLDKNELELLQYIFEHKEQFFDGKSF